MMTAAPVQLTAREREVLALLVQGITSDAEIAERLVLADRTVHWHVENIKLKLGVCNRAQIVGYALVSGLVDLQGVVWRT